jgi:hypothetical protein
MLPSAGELAGDIYLSPHLSGPHGVDMQLPGTPTPGAEKRSPHHPLAAQGADRSRVREKYAQLCFSPHRAPLVRIPVSWYRAYIYARSRGIGAIPLAVWDKVVSACRPFTYTGLTCCIPAGVFFNKYMGSGLICCIPAGVFFKSYPAKWNATNESLTLSR